MFLGNNILIIDILFVLLIIVVRQIHYLLYYQFASIILINWFKVQRILNAGSQNKQSQIIKMKNKSQKKNYRQSYMIRKQAKSQQKKFQQKDPVVFMVVDDDSIGMHLPYSQSNDMTRSLIRQNNGVWQPNFKIWKIPRGNYTSVRSQIPRILPETEIEDIPLFIDRACKPMPQKLKINETNQIISYDPLDKRIQVKQNPIYHKLYQFQKATLQLAIKNFGRLLIADEMGIGKTIQSLACALAYQSDWPLLIICPSALKHVWEQQVKKWMGQRIRKQYMEVVQKYGTVLDYSVVRIAIFSYQIASKSVEHLNKFNVVIVDEAHYLKNVTAKRTENLVPYLMSRKRVFLLSGTPALAKPREVYNLIKIIRPDIYYSLKQFGDRYCVLQRNKWSHKLQYDGCRNSAQLHYLLKNKIMIRRLKFQVLHQLPDKQRQIIQVQTCKNYVKQIKQLMNSKQIPLDVLRNNDKLVQHGQTSQSISPLSKCYLLSGLAKLQATKNYLTSLLQNDIKILIFAHHKTVMDQLEEHLQKIKAQHIRIDGSTSNEARKRNVKSFQQNSSVRVALLSITAAGVGITLTAASTVVFAELHWTPANLIQAEDRTHRIGQKACVNIHYLIGQNTIDHILLKQLEKKLNTTGDILNGSKQKLQAENMSKGHLGRWSKPAFQKTATKSQQKSILQFVNRQRSISRSHHEQSDIEEDDIPQDQLEKLISKKEAQIRQKNKMKLLSGHQNTKP